MAIFTEETQKKILAAMQETTALTKIIANGWNVDSWKAVQTIVQSGAAPKYFPVGTQLNVASTQYGTLVFDVVAHDHHKNPNDASAHTMTLLQHDVIYDRQFDVSEYLWVNTTGAEMAAGAFHFKAYKSGYMGITTEDGDYMAVTTKAIPAGGAISHTTIGHWRSSYGKDNVLKGTFTTYDASGNVIESGLTCSEGADGIDLGTLSNAQGNIVNTLGTFNSSNRGMYGSSNWRESNIRQWLNSSATSNWFTKQTIFDVVPQYYPKYGYMADLDPEFVAVVGEVDNITNHNTVFEVDGILSGSYTTRDRFFLPSNAELGFASTSQTGAAEGSVLEFYDGATAADRIKYDHSSKTTARHWWMRTVRPDTSSIAYVVNLKGLLGNANTLEYFGYAPACVIY